MGKTDYDKVDKFVEEGMRQIRKNKLLEEAGFNSSKPDEKKSFQLDQAKQTVINSVKRNLKRLIKKDEEMHEKLGISKQEMKNYIDDPSNLTADQWKKIKQIQKQLELFKKGMKDSVEEKADEKIIEEQILKHKNKRFNVRDGWLPLDTKPDH